MDIKKKQGINFDYILALSENSGLLSIEKIEIIRHDSLMDDLISMYNDSHFDVTDMVSYAKRELKYHGQIFPFCLGHHYYDSYIENVSFPEIDTNKYFQLVTEIKKRIKNALTRGDVYYAQKLEAKLKKDIVEMKKQYLNNILSYIYSYDYNETLKTNRIKESFKIFSSEIHGRFAYDTDVNDDLKITTRTNFCYGNSSYFHIIVRYKDIELLPYSEWVKYYYAGYNSIMRFTRSYFCCRESWSHTMEFLVGYVNKAISDPDAFVKQEVMSEVKGLLSGLEEIFKMDDYKFKQKLEVNHIVEDDLRYIGISSARHANDRVRENYKIKPSECAMIFRMEKVSGALYFLKSLRKLSEIYSEVKPIIGRIIELNNLIYPEIISAIPPVKEEITSLKRTLRPIEREYEYKDKRFDYLKSRLEKLIDKVEFSKRKEVEDKFKERNPQFEILEKEVQELWNKIYEYKDLINNREKILSRLESFRDLISEMTA